MGNRPSRLGYASPSRWQRSNCRPRTVCSDLSNYQLACSEIRYAIHRYSNTAYRARWSPPCSSRLSVSSRESGLTTLADPAVFQLAESLPPRGYEKRYLIGLTQSGTQFGPHRGSRQTEGWFDPNRRLVALPGASMAANRRNFWSLVDVTQVWLRDLLWDYLRDESLVADGKRIGAGDGQRPNPSDRTSLLHSAPESNRQGPKIQPPSVPATRKRSKTPGISGTGSRFRYRIKAMSERRRIRSSPNLAAISL